MTEKKIEKAVLVSADIGEYDCEASMDELSELARTAGAEEVARVIQKRDAYESATVIGEGKLEEVKELCANLGAKLLIFDCELTASQIRNIEEETGESRIPRGQASGRACAAQISPAAAYGNRREPFPTWRRNRNERSGRNPA